MGDRERSTWYSFRGICIFQVGFPGNFLHIPMYNEARSMILLFSTHNILLFQVTLLLYAMRLLSPITSFSGLLVGVANELCAVATAPGTVRAREEDLRSRRLVHTAVMPHVERDG